MSRALPLLAVVAAALAAGCGAAHPGAHAVSVVRLVTPVPTPSGASPVPAAPPPAPAASPPGPAASPPAPAASPRTSTVLPAFRATATTVTATGLGATYHAGCPTTPDQLRVLTMTFLDFAGRAETGEMVVNVAQVGKVEHVFATLYADRFPIRRMVPVSAYGGSDDASVAADNTAGYNCRDAVTASGAASWSMHAYGDAIDVDPVENPYIYGGTVDPAEGAAYTDRADHRPGMAYAGGTLNDAFADVGWFWGATFDDYQHFSTNGK